MPQLPIPIKYRENLDKEIERLLRADVIRESDSYFNSNINNLKYRKEFHKLLTLSAPDSGGRTNHVI